MKHFHLKHFLLCLLVFASIPAFAYDYEVDGIYYNLNKTTLEATVTHYSNISSENKDAYKGEVCIPQTISYSGNTYNVTTIGDYAFWSCSGLTSVTIPNSVTSIGDNAFRGCSGLTSVTIPNSVTSIGNSAFYSCSGLTSVTIPNSVTTIGKFAFDKCYELVSVNINSNAIISKNYSSNFGGIKSLIFGNQVETCIIGDSVTSIGDYVFSHCSGLTSVTIPNSVTSIGDNAFENCTGLTSVTIPNSVTRIGSRAFYNCKSVTVPDNLTNIGYETFKYTGIYVNEGTAALLALWQIGYQPLKPDTNNRHKRPYMQVENSTQTTLTWELRDKMDGYNYKVDRNGKEQEESFTVTGLWPGYYDGVSLIISHGAVSYNQSFYAYTKDIAPSITTVSQTASSITYKCSYIEGDAKVTSQSLEIGGKTVDGNIGTLTGLDPNESYQAKYTVDVLWGADLKNKKSYTKTIDLKTLGLSISTLQPKVISAGNVIVAAESNLDDAETNVGFEWRRTDWSDDFASNTGGAYLYEGKMEGYIRNLYTEKLWKYRPYYLSDSGTYYYGDWVGIDPTNTSYFEPTVHTYAQVNIEGNTALVKGYALRGTDNVVVQGFKYWKRVAGARGNAPAVPDDALTVEASGQVMTAQLNDLDYESEYCYVAFVTTSENETFYGEQQTFRTGLDTSGVEDVRVIQEPEVVARYDLRGRRIDAPQPGINILLMSDGSTRKVFVR